MYVWGGKDEGDTLSSSAPALAVVETHIYGSMKTHSSMRTQVLGERERTTPLML
jgi:hypothetical protein